MAESLTDQFVRGFRAAINDISEKWEEFVWGRVISPREQADSVNSLGDQSPSERLGWSIPGEGTERTAEPGWFARYFSPDTKRATERDHAERTQTQERGIER